MEHPREVLSRDQILENVWGYDFMGESNVIEVYSLFTTQNRRWPKAIDSDGAGCGLRFTGGVKSS